MNQRQKPLSILLSACLLAGMMVNVASAETVTSELIVSGGMETESVISEEVASKSMTGSLTTGAGTTGSVTVGSTVTGSIGVESTIKASDQAEKNFNERALMLADSMESQVIEWRRHLHEHPELPYQEYETAKYIVDALEKMGGYEIEAGIAKTGVKAVLVGGKPGPVVALRADMDGLPVKEQNTLPFKSLATGIWDGKETPIMHACGHDTHVAMLLGAAKVFSQMKDELKGTIVLIFQPAEEQGPGTPLSGANQMMAENVLENPKVDVVMGQHIGGSYPSGSISYRPGSFMASGDGFKIEFEGKGGHGSSPWSANSPLLAAAETTIALNNIVSQRTDPQDGTIVVTVGLLSSGSKMNILPDSAVIEGTVRSLSKKNQAIAHQKIQRYSENIADNHGVKVNVTLSTGYEVLVNDADVVQTIAPALDVATKGVGAIESLPLMGSEDFGAYANNGTPIVYWWLNASPFEDRAGAANHSPEFMIDEDALIVGVRALVGSALSYMEQNATKE
ncbi:amidohydrolase [Ignatzschineria rhizosphaerae]|uniref:Amidohydrolase n=1 Tax=Ignatzschineria rhizosphaerae TaxID=2923279 RepID=A0ABY3X650_9GAMM|nr:amidohydrolase [Ignatzschineria rhizosphaerae]UNM97236.1 amidohydrolase [Ignatzschineria rhizosphaerae]